MDVLPAVVAAKVIEISDNDVDNDIDDDYEDVDDASNDAASASI